MTRSNAITRNERRVAARGALRGSWGLLGLFYGSWYPARVAEARDYHGSSRKSRTGAACRSGCATRMCSGPTFREYRCLSTNTAYSYGC
jgi:hypothetical protein